MSRHIKLGLIIFNLVILTAFHQGDALECYVCNGEDDCAKELRSETCEIPDITTTTTDSSEEITDSSIVTSSTTTETVTELTTPEDVTESITTEAAVTESTTTEVVVTESITTEAADTESTTPEDVIETTSSKTETSETDEETNQSNKSRNKILNSLRSDTNRYSVKQLLFRDNINSRKRRFVLSTREESWSCYQSFEGEKVIERGCIDGDSSKDSNYEICQTDNCNPASSIQLNFTLIIMILTLTILFTTYFN